MITITDGEWIADLGAMTCKNINTQMIVEFEKSGKTYIGKIRDIPIEIMSKWAELKHGEKLVINAIREAEEVYLRALAERDFEDKK
jgi:precorrin-6B methylase 2